MVATHFIFFSTGLTCPNYCYMYASDRPSYSSDQIVQLCRPCTEVHPRFELWSERGRVYYILLTIDNWQAVYCHMTHIPNSLNSTQLNSSSLLSYIACRKEVHFDWCLCVLGSSIRHPSARNIMKKKTFDWKKNDLMKPLVTWLLSQLLPKAYQYKDV